MRGRVAVAAAEVVPLVVVVVVALRARLKICLLPSFSTPSCLEGQLQVEVEVEEDGLERARSRWFTVRDLV